MSRKPKKGYFVKGHFVAEGSELDLELKAELKGTHDASRTDLKRESDALQDLGKDLLTLRADLFQRIGLPDKLADALAEARRITNFEGKRRQMQFVGKLMRKLDEDVVAAARAALEEQRNGSAADKLLLHQAEHWRDLLIAQDTAQAQWIAQYPGTDIQQLRALIRQARKDAPSAHDATVAEAQGLAPRKGRAYRELFALVREQINATHTETHGSAPSDDPAHAAD
ncbi:MULTISPECIES: ribosome biogenesis factor YjgA [Giesbergeria]|uniref:Dual-action ribosomal maturation protein DarP n=1 Tax=Giesbergeria sinuosa TaxID=80883 RepID=A0ABV9QGP7_9BURK